MGQTYDYIPEEYIVWALKQRTFWVATAPLSADGHVNVSPKGVEGTFHIENKNKAWYEDLTGSGIETFSHLRENKRITILFNAFDGGPRILRLFGTGSVHEFGTPEYEALLPVQERHPGSRGIIVIDVNRVGTSCGWGVPFYSYVGPRDTLENFGCTLERKDREHAAVDPGTPAEKGIAAYWKRANLRSIDGIPGMLSAHLSRVTPVAPVKEKELLARLGSKGKRREDAFLVSRKYDEKTTENMRLLVAFVAGLLVTALYTRVTSIAAETLGSVSF